MINGNYFLLNVVLLAVGTIMIRGSFISIAGKMNISAKVKDLFTYIPAAILPAIIIPGTFFHPAGKERFFIIIAAMIVGYYKRNTLLIISFGLLLLWLVTNYSL